MRVCGNDFHNFRAAQKSKNELKYVIYEWSLGNFCKF